jgi:predicted Abi (CAAX) family protease
MPVPAPSSRTLVGVGLILLLIVLWAALVASVAYTVAQWPVFVQAIFYLVVGIGWIIPLKPLVRWMLTGRFKPPSREELK